MTFCGRYPSCASRYATRDVSVFVLPDPGGARTCSTEAFEVTAARCAAFSPLSMESIQTMLVCTDADSFTDVSISRLVRGQCHHGETFLSVTRYGGRFEPRRVLLIRRYRKMVRLPAVLPYDSREHHDVTCPGVSAVPHQVLPAGFAVLFVTVGSNLHPYHYVWSNQLTSCL